MSDQFKNRSNFVTVTAWIFIILFSFLTLISIMQNVMLFTLFRNFDNAIQENQKNILNDLKNDNKSILDNHKILYIILPSFLIISITVLISSIGLLNRKNWARILFITILFIIIVYMLSIFILQFYSFFNIKANTSFLSFDKTYYNFIILMIIFSVLFNLAVLTSLVLINIKLLSNKIKIEFKKNL